jgi:hypothetical protein
MSNPTDKASFDPVRFAERERCRLTRNQRRNYFRQFPIDLDHAVTAACRWLLPWSWAAYPGVERGLRQVVGGYPRSKSAILGNWVKKNNAPPEVMRTLADAVGARARQGLQIEAALRTEITKKETAPRKPRGLEIIDTETGLPKYRNQLGKRKRDQPV